MRNVLLFVIILTAASAAAAQSGSRRVDFKNFTYRPECLGDTVKRVTVKNGEYLTEKHMDGWVDRMWFSVPDVEYGDVNGDGREDAIVLTVCNTGGTGNFSEGFIYTLRGGKPAMLARIPGGDRAYGGLRRARVENKLLVVDSNDAGTHGGACCPEVIVTTRYKVTNGRLVKFGKEERRDIYPSERVAFMRGTSGVTLKAKIAANEGKRFVVSARAGQVLSVSVDSDKAEVRVLEEAMATEGVNGLSAKLPKNGNYTVQVLNLSDAELTVNVTIKIR